MKKFFLILITGFFINLYYSFGAVDLPDHYKFPENYFKGKFYNTVKNNFVVATRGNRDPRFKKTVIVMLDHDENGALGLVINKPLGKVLLSSLINQSSNSIIDNNELYNVKIPIFWGGPLDNDKIIVLHSGDYQNEKTKNYAKVSINSDIKVLLEIAKKKGPKNNLIILGVSAWSDGQLEGEIGKGWWTLSEINTDLIFEKDNEKKWLNAIKNQFVPL